MEMYPVATVRPWIPIPTRSMVFSTIDEYERLVSEMRGAINLEVTIERDKLLEQVKKNRAKHKDDFDSAMEVYNEQCLKELRKRAEKVELFIAEPEASLKADEDFTPESFMRFHLSCPRQYLEVYDQVIESMTWTTEKEIKLSGDQFRNWVMDKWDWSEQFHSTVREYNRLK